MKNLRLIRQSNNLTTSQVAEKIGVSLRTYQNYENGSTEMPFELILKIADYFNCSIDYLLGHQAKNIVYTESLTPVQQKLFELIKKLTDEQGLFLIGYISDMLKIPYDEVKPVRPW